MKECIRNILLAAAVALMAGGNGVARAEEGPARLAVYVNGVLQFCIEGTAQLRDIPYREGTSDPRATPELKAASTEEQACPESIPRKLPLPANVSALEGESKSFMSEGERMTVRTFIFGSGKIETDTKAIERRGY